MLRSGSLNGDILLSLEDGVGLIFRSPRTYYCLPPETTGELLESEVATMMFMKLSCSIPVPYVLRL